MTAGTESAANTGPLAPLETANLEVDLRGDGSGRVGGDSVLTLQQVIEAVKRPRSLPRLLRSRHFSCLRVHLDELPLGVTQAVALAALCLARADHFAISSPPVEEGVSRVGL